MRIVVASENKSTREAVGLLIRAQSDLQLAKEVSDIADLLAVLKATGAQLVILDWDDLGKRIEVLMDLLQLFDKPPCIVALSINENARGEALRFGIADFAYKGDPPHRLLATIREAKSHRVSLRPFIHREKHNDDT